MRACVASSSGPGDWSGTAPICEGVVIVTLLICQIIIDFRAAITCTDLPALENGQIAYSMDATSPHQFETVATFSCDPGYALVGEYRSSTCGGDSSNTDGSWSGSLPSCQCKITVV